MQETSISHRGNGDRCERREQRQPVSSPPRLLEGTCDLAGPSQWWSPDLTTTAWYTGASCFTIQTSDHRRAARLRCMTRVEFVGECIAGGPFMQLFDTDRKKLRTEAMRRLLWWGVGPGKDRVEFMRETGAELATATPAGG